MADNDYTQFPEKDEEDFLKIDPEEPPVEIVDNSTRWDVKISIEARLNSQISPSQGMLETKKFDVTDQLTENQLLHILECIQPINQV